MQLNVAAVLEDHLKVKGLTAYRVAKDSGLTTPAVDNVLKGSDFKASTIEKICGALGVKVSVIYALAEEAVK